MRTSVRPPDPHAGGARPPAIAPEFLPRHVALVMDGNGRWAKERGLPRTEGHKRGEYSLFDVIMGAVLALLAVWVIAGERWPLPRPTKNLERRELRDRAGERYHFGRCALAGRA